MRLLSLCGISLLALLLIGSQALGDRLVLNDGRSLDGEVVEQNDQTVTLEIHLGGSKLVQKIARDQIRTWYRRSTDGQPYVTLPINGVIGEDITPEALRAGFGQARAAGAKYVVLAINSPGGRIGAMAEMVDDVLAESRQTEVIAYVKQAYSAAAVIAMSCRQVYLTPDGAIGAVVPFQMTENGPAEVDAKFRSAFQAKIRATAAMAEHADLVIRGMSELDLEIFLTQQDGKPVLRTSGEGKKIKARGQILSLTAPEAQECGLAMVAQSMSELGEKVVGGPWHEVDRRAWNAVIDRVAASRQKEQAEQQRAQRSIARQTAIARIKPECDLLARRLNEVRARFLARQVDMAQIQKQYQAEADQVEKEFEQESARAQDRGSTAAMNQAQADYGNRLAAVKKKLDASLEKPRSEYTAAALEALGLESRLKELIATVPED